MEPLSFILTTASAILAGIITDLVTGKTKAALKVELEQQVTRTVVEKLRQSEQKPPKIDQIIRQTVDEIRILAQEDPDLRVFPEKIELTNPVKKPFLPFQDRNLDKEVDSRLERLNAIIAQRRKQLGLPPESEEENNQKTDDRDAPSNWRHIP